MASPCCFYCNAASFTHGWTTIELCEQHFELHLIKANLARTGRKFTPQSAGSEMVRKSIVDGYHFSFALEEIPHLVEQMQVEDFRCAVVLPTD